MTASNASTKQRTLKFQGNSLKGREKDFRGMQVESEPTVSFSYGGWLIKEGPESVVMNDFDEKEITSPCPCAGGILKG